MVIDVLVKQWFTLKQGKASIEHAPILFDPLRSPRRKTLKNGKNSFGRLSFEKEAAICISWSIRYHYFVDPA